MFCFYLATTAMHFSVLNSFIALWHSSSDADDAYVCPYAEKIRFTNKFYTVI